MSNFGSSQQAMARLLPGLCVVVPVYNSQSTLPLLVARLEPVLSQHLKDYELILVDDGSRDQSWPCICKLAAQHHWVCGITLLRNYGQHNALLCGVRAARHEMIVTMDDDLQHPPEEIPLLLAKLGEGNDVVYGTPVRQQHGVWRDLASTITKLVLQNSMGAKTASQVSAFRAFRTHLRAAFADYRSPFLSIDVVLTWATTRFTAVTVRHDPRQAGASNYTMKKLMAHAMNMVTGFSSLPLQIASWLGFTLTLFGLAILVFVVGRYLIQGGSVPGFSFLACIIAIFSGAQLFVIGIIGEYLARMHFRMMERPTYAIASTTFRDR
jgi:undecaprenyl-phosphate 4-deoxy-4-formamido-L-arabinose transferase